MGDRIKKGIEYEERGQVGYAIQLELVCSAPGSHHDAQSYPGIFGGLQVADSISDTDAFSQIQIVTFSRLQKETWPGFSTITGILWGMGTNESIVHPASGCLNYIKDMLMEFQSGLQGKDAPANRRLVGNKEYFNVRMVQFSQCIQRTGQEDDLFQAADVVGLVFDDHPIPIEE